VRPKVPNDELRRRRLALGWSQERLANELNRRMAAAGLAGTCTGRRVARWERGQARPGTDYAPFLAEALGCTLAQLGLKESHNAGLARLAASPRPVVLLQLPELPAGWLPGLPSASTDASADALAVEAFRTADRQVGGGHLYASVVRYLQAELGPRLFGATSGQGGPELFCAAAGLTDLAGWMAYDAGHDQRAREHFDRAIGLAAVGGDQQLGAQALSGLSHLTDHLGNPEQATALARRGQARLGPRPGNPELAARLLAMQARGLSGTGNATGCVRALLRAEEALGREFDQAPSPWVSRFDEASLASEAARCLRRLGDLEAARRHAERVIALRSGQRARSRAFGQLMLASVLAARGELDGACTVGYEVVGATHALGSVVVVRQLDGLRGLLEPYRSARVVAEFLGYLGEALRERAWLSPWLSVDRAAGGEERARVSVEQPSPTWQHLAEGNATQARKRVGADVLLRDQAGRLLLVDPRYKPDWDLPGGMAEADEPPRQAARREVTEELGLDLQVGRVLCVDWVSPHGPWDDSLMFIFDGGVLTDQDIAGLRLLDGELRAFRFCTETEAATLLRDYVWRRVQAAIEALHDGQASYLEDGRP
jgi:8-oxo-dGTP pyrophosphatase MutT (NUDIX family)/transcriptional regulator with XRE-family HTH domain